MSRVQIKNGASKKSTETLKKIRSLCGPFVHYGHVVKDIHAAMESYLALGIGPFFYIAAERERRWDKQFQSGGGRKGKLRETQLHYGEPTAYRALVAMAYNGETGIELIQPYNDEPSCHNDWLKRNGNGLQHICFSSPPEHYVEIVEACLDAGWIPSIQLIEGDGKPGSGPPGKPNMPTVHYFDTMDEFGFHIEIACNGGEYPRRFQQFISAYVKDWDGVTEPIRGRGIGEIIRLTLHISGLEFEDHRYTGEQFAAVKDTTRAETPFGQFPAIKTESGTWIAQTVSMARYGARIGGIYPSDPLSQSISDMIVDHTQDIHSSIAKMQYDGVPGAVGTKRRSNEEIKRLMMEWKTGKLHHLLLALEQLHPNDSKYFVDNKLSWADVAVYNRLNALLDHFPDLMDDRKKYPCLQVCHETIGSLKCVHDWVANHPDDYKDTSRYLY